jgi:hypothetical protein
MWNKLELVIKDYKPTSPLNDGDFIVTKHNKHGFLMYGKWDKIYENEYTPVEFNIVSESYVSNGQYVLFNSVNGIKNITKCRSTDNNVFHFENGQFSYKDNSHYHKIIATTNTELSLPLLSTTTIAQIVNMYNSHDKLNKGDGYINGFYIWVECTETPNKGRFDTDVYDNVVLYDNNVNIRLKEVLLNDNDLIKILRDFTNDFSLYRGVQILEHDIIKWVNKYPF